MLVSGSDASQAEAAEVLAQRLESLARPAGLESRLEAAGVPRGIFPLWLKRPANSGQDDSIPRPFGIEEALEVYEWAF